MSRAGYDVDAMSIVPIASFEDWIGHRGGAELEGRAFPHPQAFHQPGRLSRSIGAAAAGVVALPSRAARGESRSASNGPMPSIGRSGWIARESPAQIRRHEASNSVAFLEQFIGLMSVGRDRPVYKLLHVGVPHRPIVVDRECRFIGLTDMSRRGVHGAIALRGEARRRAARSRARARHLRQQPHHRLVRSRHRSAAARLQRQERKPVAGARALRHVRLPAIASAARKAIMFIKPPEAHRPDHGFGCANVARRSAVDDSRHSRSCPAASPDASMFDSDPKQPRTRIYGMYNPRQRFPKAYLDRSIVLTIDGRVLDAAAWHVQRLIWRPDVRLENRDVDVGPREAHRYLGPGWSLRTARTRSRQVMR